MTDHPILTEDNLPLYASNTRNEAHKMTSPSPVWGGAQLPVQQAPAVVTPMPLPAAQPPIVTGDNMPIFAQPGMAATTGTGTLPSSYTQPAAYPGTTAHSVYPAHPYAYHPHVQHSYHPMHHAVHHPMHHLVYIPAHHLPYYPHHYHHHAVHPHHYPHHVHHGHHGQHHHGYQHAQPHGQQGTHHHHGQHQS
ncbi:hypothetical protein [Paenibacillus ferrarius]|uniref:hypothetical protein n=1 Tax=Paenibacillus ferrarius TaxID=1469647 RepID=UPI003D2B0542